MKLELPSQLQHYINGQLVAPVSGKMIAKSNPATDEHLYHLPDGDLADVELAVEAAKHAFPFWRNTSAEERFRYLNRIAELIVYYLDDLSLAETNDNGKPLWLSTSSTHWRCRMYFSLESATLFVYLENCACTGSRQLRGGKTFRSNTCNSIPAFKNLYRSRIAGRCIEYRAWNRTCLW